ncbi:UNVERIFIED_CONTAM: hypothetical protein K2H54_072598 [Gekko kuhli]
MLLRRSGFNAEKEISYLIKIEGIYRIVHLRRKSFIIANMPFYTFNMRGERLVDHPYIQDCYYGGYVEDVPDSDVVLSTCAGLWGHVRIGSLTYEIRPVENSPTFQHLLYQAAPEQREPCGGVLEDQDESERNPLGSGKPESPPAGHSSQRLMKDPVDAAARYLEYYVVCDSSIYQWGNRNETRVMLLMLQIISVLQSIYEELGLHIILIGMEMWTERDFSTVSQKKLAKTLERFYNYATFELQRHVHFDHATIYTRVGEEGSFGMSWGERLCLSHHVSVSAVKTSPSATHSGVSAAHELGHSLGFLHDNDVLGGDCDCNCVSEPGRCIMYSGIVKCHRLSNCSKKAYYELLQTPGKSCLRNLPKEAPVKKECGNGAVEGDEECDCGLVQASEGVSSSTFSSSGVPAELLAKEGTTCREAATDCDLPEYCTGASADCPLDVHKQDGERCGTGDICFTGQCSDLSQHCRAVFGKGKTNIIYCTMVALAQVVKTLNCRLEGVKRAPRSCFKKVNAQGDRTGNCGTGRPGYKKCEEEHALCGRIQCTNIKRIPVLPTRQAVLQTPVGNIWCWGVEFHEGLDAYDIGATPDGSSCGAGKICVNRSCVHVGVRKSTCDSSRCNNRGVCNSRQNCHCAYGWAPPFCEGKGYGGSVDSGPPPKPKVPTNLIIGSTIGAVCLFLAVLLVKKHVVDPWLARQEMEEDSDLDDLDPTEESEAEEALPIKKPTEETTQASFRARIPPPPI